MYEMATDSSYAVGMLVAKTANLGTVVIEGRVRFTGTSDWDLAILLAANETFRPGAYYLSNTDPGKMTAEAKGPAI